MEPRVTLITLTTRDLERAVRFYRDGLGWPLSEHSVAGDVAFFQAGGMVVGIYGLESQLADAQIAEAGTGFGGIVLAHNVRSATEVDAVLREAVAAGARLLRAGYTAPWGGYIGYFADPDGHTWEVAWNPGWPLAEDGSLTLP
jgi:catechol 2,3-dioxygenase-like lactoylglutathione lyase family enzyme